MGVRTAVKLIVSMSLMLISVAAGSATADQPSATKDEGVMDASPRWESRERGFTPAGPGESGPALPFPGMTSIEADQERAVLAAQDQRDFAAAERADAVYRADPTRGSPVDPNLEHGDSGEYPIHEGTAPDLPKLPPEYNGTNGHSTLASCMGNCYQTDRIDLANPAVGLFASEFWVWLAIPQAGESNRCDGSSHSGGCFWFAAMQYNTDSQTTATGFHIGPQRGVSIAGDAGSKWRMNIDGYIDGVHIGAQSPVNLPVATWIRVRTWRLDYGYDSWTPYTPWATWGVWAYYNGSDHYLGSLTLDGHLIDFSMVFQEVYEASLQCTTDLERTYFNDYRWWNTSASQRSYSLATAGYETNCANTSWERPYAGSGEFLRDERNTARSIGQGWLLWQLV